MCRYCLTFTAYAYSREVPGSWIRGLNVSSHVAVSNSLIFGCSKATVLVPVTPGRNYVVICQCSLTINKNHVGVWGLQHLACSFLKVWAERSPQLSAVLPWQHRLRPRHANQRKQRFCLMALISENKYLWYSQIHDSSSTKGVKCFDKHSLGFLMCCLSSICNVVFHNLRTKRFPSLHVKMNSACHWIYFSWLNMCSQACFQNRTAVLWM